MQMLMSVLWTMVTVLMPVRTRMAGTGVLVPRATGWTAGGGSVKVRVLASKHIVGNKHW